MSTAIIVVGASLYCFAGIWMSRRWWGEMFGKMTEEEKDQERFFFMFMFATSWPIFLVFFVVDKVRFDWLRRFYP